MSSDADRERAVITNPSLVRDLANGYIHVLDRLIRNNDARVGPQHHQEAQRYHQAEARQRQVAVVAAPLPPGVPSEFDLQIRNLPSRVVGQYRQTEEERTTRNATVQIDVLYSNGGIYYLTFHLQLQIGDTYQQILNAVRRLFEQRIDHNFSQKDGAWPQEIVGDEMHVTFTENERTYNWNFDGNEQVNLDVDSNNNNSNSNRNESQRKRGRRIGVLSHANQAILNCLNPVGIQNNDMCISRYIWQAMVHRKNELKENNTRQTFKVLSQLEIVNEIEAAALEHDRIIDVAAGEATVFDIIRWARTKKHISVYALDDLRFQVYQYHAAEKHKLTLAFVIASNHLYPITHPEAIRKIQTTKQINIEDFHCVRSNLFSTDIKELDDREIYDWIEGNDFKHELLTYDGPFNNHLCTLVERVGYPYKINVNESGNIVSIQHPTSLTFLLLDQETKLKTQVLKYIYEQLNEVDFLHYGQSWMQMTNDLFSHLVGKLPVHRDTEWDSFTEKYQPFPIIQLADTSGENQYNREVAQMALDHKKCYSMTMLLNEDSWLVPTNYDDWKPFSGNMIKNAFYITKAFTFYGLYMPVQIRTYSAVEWLVHERIITLDSIILVREIRQYLSNELMQPFVKFILKMGQELENESIIKKMINPFVGNLNSRLLHQNTPYITNSFDDIRTLFENVPQKELKFYNLGTGDSPLWVAIHSKVKERKKFQTSYWCTIVANANIRVMKKIHEIKKTIPQCIVEAVKVDCIYFSYVRKDNILNDPYWHEIDYILPKLQCKGQREEPELKNDWNVIEKDHMTLGSCLVTGDGGSGKTTLAATLISQKSTEWDRIICSAFTNAAVDNLQQKLSSARVPNSRERRPGHVRCQTLDSLLYKGEDDDFKQLEETDYLVIDEVSMISKKHMNLLVQLPNISIMFLGDFNQCPPVEGESVTYRYNECLQFKKVCQFRWCQMEYIAASGRYSQQTYEYLNYFKRNRKLHPDFINLRVNPDLDRNIVKTNRMRNEIRNKWHTRYEIGQTIITNKIGLETKFKKYKAAGVYTSTMYEIEEIHEDKVKLYGIDILVPFSFIEPIYAITTYKYQGKTIDVPHNIQELREMSFEEAYTALSRTSDWTFWHFDFTNKAFEHSELQTKKFKLCSITPTIFYINENKVDIISQKRFNSLPAENQYEIGSNRLKMCRCASEQSIKIQKKIIEQELGIAEEQPTELFIERMNFDEDEYWKNVVKIKEFANRYEIPRRQFGQQARKFLFTAANKELKYHEALLFQQEMINDLNVESKVEPIISRIRYEDRPVGVCLSGTMHPYTAEPRMDPELFTPEIVSVNHDGMDIEINAYKKLELARIRARENGYRILKVQDLYMVLPTDLVVAKILSSNERKQEYVFRNSRLFCEMKTDNLETIVQLVDVATEVAEEYGVELHYEDWRYVIGNGCSRLINLKEVFHSTLNQLQFWGSVQHEIGLHRDEYSDIVGLIDNGSYFDFFKICPGGSLQCGFIDEECEWVDGGDEDIKDFLISTEDDPLTFLSHNYEENFIPKFTMKKNVKLYGKLPILLKSKLEKYDVENQFEIDHVQYFKDQYVKYMLERTSAGLCPICRRWHTCEGLTMYASKRGTVHATCNSRYKILN